MRVDMYTPDLTRIGTLPALSGEMVLTLNGVHRWDIGVDTTNAKWARFQKSTRVRISDEHRTYLDGPASNIGSRTTRTGVHTVALLGESYDTYLDEMITLPDPSRAADKQDVDAYWRRAGWSAEKLMHALIGWNIAEEARPEYRVPHLVRRPDLGRGRTLTFQTRFKNLLEELQELSTAGGLNFCIRQDGRQLAVEFFEGRDLSRAVRLTRNMGAIGETDYRQVRPQVTEVIVAGQGVGEKRTIIRVARDPGPWGRRVTVFKDRRDTDDEGELRQAANVDLDDAQEVASVRVEVSDAASKRFGRDFWLGDKITLDLGYGNTITDVVTEAVVKWGPKGRTVELNVGPKLSSPEDPLWVDPVERILARLGSLERI